MPDQRLPATTTGVASIDRLIGGLLAGDNVVWIGDDPALHDRIEHAFLGAGNGPATLVVLDPARTPSPPPGVDVLEAGPGRPLADPVALERMLHHRGQAAGARIVVRGLDALVHRLGTDGAVAFFTRTCPRLFDLGAQAYWRATRTASGPALDAIRRVTQCVIDHTGHRLRVVKAEGRPGVGGRIAEIRLEGGRIELDEVRAVSRLAEGLRRVRLERGLTQTEIASMAGVSPSAISQAEGGHRGLSLETLLTLSEALGVKLDDLLSHHVATGYVVARRDRVPPRRGMVALLDDPAAGLRSHLITLDGGDSGAPPTVHKGAELVHVASGVVQIELNDETPVLRGGDALLVTTDAIRGWRNLLSDPARLFWIVRDD